jgi:hypothetical protein
VIVRPPEAISYDGPGAPQAAQVSIPAKYEQVDSSGIVKQVAAGDNVINIELTAE